MKGVGSVVTAVPSLLTVINLSAEVRVYKELAARTGGLHTVVLDDLHLRDMLSQHLDPPAYATDLAANLVKMGFPSHAGRLRMQSTQAAFCCLHHRHRSVALLHRSLGRLLAS